MAEQIVIHNAHELEVYKKTILMNLDKNIKQIKLLRKEKQLRLKL